jgi:hypothetical protein
MRGSRSSLGTRRLIERQRSCMSASRRRPYRYQGGGFDPSYRFLAAHTLAWGA